MNRFLIYINRLISFVNMLGTICHKTLNYNKKINKPSYIAPVDDIPASAAAIKSEHIVEPNMPVGVYIQEAFNIHSFAQDDREILVLRGLNWGVLE